MIIEITCRLIGSAPISFSKAKQSVRTKDEDEAAFSDRTWREHLHVDEHDEVYIPPMALKNCLVDKALYRGEKIVGKGQATYTKLFQAGVLVTEPIMLGIKTKDVKPERLFLPSDGKRGGGKRVWKIYPTIPKWSGEAHLYIIDDRLCSTPEKVLEYLKLAGKLIGMGRFRARNGGLYGRFTVEDFAWKKIG